MKTAHPEAVVVEDVERDVALAHAVDETGDGRLIVLRRERGREPQAERPCRRQRRPAGQAGVAFEHLLGRRTVDHEILELLAADAELRLGDPLRGNFEFDTAGMVDENAPAVAGQEERHVLVGLLGAGAAIAIPDVDRLAVLHERREALAEAIDVFSDREVEAFEDVGLPRIAFDRVAGVLAAAAGDRNAVPEEGEAVAPVARQYGGEGAAAQCDGRLRLFDITNPRVAVDFEIGSARNAAQKMRDADADHPFGRREEAQREGRRVDLIAARAQLSRGDARNDLPPLGSHVMHVQRMQQREIFRDQPVAVDEFHVRTARFSWLVVGRDIPDPSCAIPKGCAAGCHSQRRQSHSAGWRRRPVRNCRERSIRSRRTPPPVWPAAIDPSSRRRRP